MLVSPLAVAQGIDLTIARPGDTPDYNFSWLQWFETHGQVYLRERVADRPLPWDTPPSRRYRGQAVDALLPLLDDTTPSVRAAAVLALARIGDVRLLHKLLPADGAVNADGQDTLGKPLLDDPSLDVRLAAWAALGLFDTPAVRSRLAQPPGDDATEFDRAAQAVAIGLLHKQGIDHRAFLLARLEDVSESLEVKRCCLWALRQDDSATNDGLFDAVLLRLPSPFLIQEVLLNPGYVQRRGGGDWLVGVLKYYPEIREWPGYRVLGAMPAAGRFGSTPRRLGMETRVAATLTLAGMPTPEREDDRVALLDTLKTRMVAGNSAQRMDFNRGFDTISYALHCGGSTSDLDLLYDMLRGFAMLPADDPAVSTERPEGEPASPGDLRQRQADNPVRGFAAIAAGLLIRRGTEGTQLHDKRPLAGLRGIEIERIKRRFGVRLMRAIADPDEPLDYRAACALALGLSGDDRYVEELVIELGRLKGGDELVLGHGLLALAMLGDERAAEPAFRYVSRPGRVGGIDDLLGRRAALRAVALLGEASGDNGRAALVGAWGRDLWVGLDAAEVAAWCGFYDAVPLMIESTRGESPRWREAAAVAIGRVYDRDFPPRLLRLSEGQNVTMSFRLGLADVPAEEDSGRVGVPSDGIGWPIRRLHALGDPLLYTRMLR